MIQGGSHRSDHGTGAGRPVSAWRLPGLRGFVALGGAVVVALGLAACNGAQAEPEPDPLDTIEVDAEPEPEAEPEADDPGPEEYEHPEPGPDIDDEGQAGAEAAAVYFVELYSYVYATGDFEAWDELTTEDCNFCSSVRQRVADLYADDGYVLADPPQFDSLSPHIWADSPGDYSVQVIFTSPELEVFDRDGASIEEFEEADTEVWVLVEVRDGDWYVLGASGSELE